MTGGIYSSILATLDCRPLLVELVCVHYMRTEVLYCFAEVLNNFKKLLHRLEQCRVYENQQTLSDEPGT